jgi:FkbM family methyltransferase
MSRIKWLASRLPLPWQRELRRLRFRRMIQRGDFHAGEPEFDRLSEWIGPGDWALDIGANVGHYTLEMSRIVGLQGRVIALEPIPETFGILVGNLVLAGCRNVTPLNIAASDRVEVVKMRTPRFASGLENFYQARIVQSNDTTDGHHHGALALTLDNLGLEHRVALVKIDVEGHEQSVLNGMQILIQRDRPVLILENPSEKTDKWLVDLGYRSERIPNSPNGIYLT